MRAIAGLALAFAIAACGDRGRQPAPVQPIASIDSALTVRGRRVPPALLNAYIAARLGFTSRGGEMRCAYVPLGAEGDRLFVSTLCLELVRDGDSLAVGSGRGGPVALRVAAGGDSVRIVSHEVPDDGSRHAPSIRRIFPRAIAARILGPGPERNARVAQLESYLHGEAASRLGLRPPPR